MATDSSTLSNFSKSSKRTYPFLRFDAFSMKDLINKKLSEDSDLTDHLYDGSNISIFVDIVSTMFESLMFNLNQSAAESSPSDALIYKNLSKLVKFVGYSPKGFKSSTVNVSVKSKSKDMSFMVVPKYSTITLDDTDYFGNNISFSTVDYAYINADSTDSINLVNGKWVKYNSVFKAQGEPYEKFILSNISVDDDETYEVAYPYIDVYVKRPIGNGEYETIYYSAITDGIYIDTTEDSILTTTDYKFALRLNENKKYELEFGDGVHGAMLKEGDYINVVYLRSNGKYGCINSNDISNKQFTVGIDNVKGEDETGGYNITMSDILELDSTYNNSIYKNSSIIKEYIDDTDESYKEKYGEGVYESYFYYGCTNYEKSSTPTEAETVEQIRTNAPNHFKRVGRVNTSDDFTNTIKERFYADIVDCVTMNNLEYRNTFNKWLWRLGIEKCNNPRKWLNPNLMSLGIYGYKYSDASDSNNVYIWLKQETEIASIGNAIVEDLKDECPITANIVIVQSVDEKFAICAGCTDTYNSDGSMISLRDYYNSSNDSDYFTFNDKGQNRLEITLRSETNISETIIKNRILEVFKNFFSSSVMNIGDTVSLGTLENNILDINGVARVRTIFRKLLPDGSYSNTDIIRKSGVCLAHWNENIVNGYDIETSNGNITLEKFQYPVFNNYKDILDQIDIIVDGSVNISET